MEKGESKISELAEAMRGYREENGLTRRQMADRIGMKYMTYCPIEFGYHAPGKKALAKIAKGLGLRYCEAKAMSEKEAQKKKEAM